MTPLLAMEVPTRLVHLSPIDVVIVVFYFALVLSIGWYLKGRATRTAPLNASTDYQRATGRKCDSLKASPGRRAHLPILHS